MSYVTDRELIEGFEAQEEHAQELGKSAVVELDDQESHVQELGEIYEAQEVHVQELGESAVVELEDPNDLNK